MSEMEGRKEGRVQGLPEDLEDLVNLRVAWKERFASAHLGENSSNRPHINASRVLTSTEKNFRGTVP
jgi:hypothetical protein